ncbi:MAG: Hpt domain-containing protein, partial [Oscillospiraceae bacterium]
MGSGNEILDMYLYETSTLLEQLDSIVLAAEHVDSFSQDEVNEIFRIMHTIKGSSAMMEFNSLMTIAHRIEDLFFIIREKTMDAVPEQDRPTLFDLMFQAIDFFRGEVTKIENNEPLSQSIDTFLENINTFIAKIKRDSAAEAAEAASAALSSSGAAPAPSAYGSNGDFPFVLHVLFDEGCGMESLRAYMLVTSIGDFCAESDFVYEPKGVETHPETSETIIENGFLLRFRRVEDRDNAIPVVTSTGSVKTYQIADTPPAETPAGAAPPVSETAAETAVLAVPGAASAPIAAVPGAGHQSNKESLISVNLSKLDQLMAV